ncbi:hypothetical protein ACWDPF_33650 [Streptomyces albogriseolus]
MTTDPQTTLAAPTIPTDEARRINDDRMRAEMERRAHRDQVDNAFRSPEATRIRELVVADGNVDWREFVVYCGGILEVVAMVDQYGRPDTDRIIPKVDELFYERYSREEYVGMTVTRHPRNRPYCPPAETSAAQ